MNNPRQARGHGDITAIVDSNENLNVTFLTIDGMDCPPFTVNVTGNTMTGNFSRAWTGSFTVTRQ
jgi:hypothetical protein